MKKVTDKKKCCINKPQKKHKVRKKNDETIAKDSWMLNV